MSNTDILNTTAERLGIHDDTILSKAKEFLRLLESKGSVKSLYDTARTVLCLDLASSFLGLGFNKDIALKLSGLKKSAYQNNLHTVEKILGLDKPLSISELCVQLSCTLVKEIAEEIFDRYKAKNKILKDMEHPQYGVAAVYTACKLKNVKIQKSLFLALSRLKNTQWQEITTEFENFASFLKTKSSNMKVGSEKEAYNRDGEVLSFAEKQTSIINNNEEKIEIYEDWKKRILEEAYNALKMKQI